MCGNGKTFLEWLVNCCLRVCGKNPIPQTIRETTPALGPPLLIKQWLVVTAAHISTCSFGLVSLTQSYS